MSPRLPRRIATIAPRLTRRTVALVTLAGLASLAGLPGRAQAQAPAPSGNPIHLLVGFPAGAGTDAIARVLAEKLPAELGSPVVVENRAGAGGQIAAQALKNAAPDGRTFFLSHDHTISILPLVTKNPGFNPSTDFTPVAGFATFANVLAVSGGTPAKTLPEYVNWVKTAKGGKDSIGVPAPGSIPVFMVQLIAKKYGVDVQAAPYRGGAPMIGDMLGNQIAAGVGSVPDLIEYQKTGRMHIVATLGAKRDPLLPQVPTFGELGFANLDDYPWYGVFAPNGTPRPVVDKFSAALQKVLAQPDVHKRLTDMGLNVAFEPQSQFAGRVRTYTETWAQIIKSSGFQPQ